MASRRNVQASTLPPSYAHAVPSLGTNQPVRAHLLTQGLEEEHFIHRNLHKSRRHVALLTPCAHICRFQSRKLCRRKVEEERRERRVCCDRAEAAATPRRLPARTGLFRGGGWEERGGRGESEIRVFFFSREGRQRLVEKVRQRVGSVKKKVKSARHKVFTCWGYFSAESGGQLGAGRLEGAGHVTPKSKGLYLKVSSRLPAGSDPRLRVQSTPPVPSDGSPTPHPLHSCHSRVVVEPPIITVQV